MKTLSIKKLLASSIPTAVSSAVVTRRRKYEVSVADLCAKPEPPKPVHSVPQKPQAAPKSSPPPPVKARKAKVPVPPAIPREERIAACLAALKTAWPLLFDETAIVLWEVGIKRKFWRGLDKNYSRTLISHALAYWQAHHPDYRELLKTVGNPRYGVDGTVTMVVTEEQARQAVLPVDPTESTARIFEGFP